MSRAKVLLVEDNSDVRRLYAIGLNRRGFEVQVGGERRRGCRAPPQRAARHHPSRLAHAAHGRGAVLQYLKQNGSAPIAIIVISGQPAPSRVDPSIKRWLTKPVTVDELVNEIERPRVAAGQ